MKQSAIFQLDAADMNLEAIQLFSAGDVQGGSMAILGSISVLLDSMEVLDITGTLAADIADGRAAVAARDVAAGIAAVASTRAKLV